MNKVEDISSDEESPTHQNADLNFLSDNAMALVALEKTRRTCKVKPTSFEVLGSVEQDIRLRTFYIKFAKQAFCFPF